LFLTHLRNETNTLYRKQEGLLRDATAGTGLGPPSLAYTSFGTGFLDADNDGWLDLLVVSGTVRLIEEQLRGGEALPLRQRNQLFRNRGEARFEEWSGSEAGPLAESAVSRGLAVGDLDNDGDLDAVVVNNSAPAQLLVNRLDPAGGWVGFEVRARPGGDHAVGTRVELSLADGRRLSRWVRRDGSFLSARDPRVHFGLGASAAEDRVSISLIWPDGEVEERGPFPPGAYHVLSRSADGGGV
ncbi:MAG: FG-GAP-like repeat-containing protein, partial [Thermoanaerobaculia bacterium]|nr:FG-GAP-like repeat-containing protein [Thermoanaerobaculia bacterium]